MQTDSPLTIAGDCSRNPTHAAKDRRGYQTGPTSFSASGPRALAASRTRGPPCPPEAIAVAATLVYV